MGLKEADRACRAGKSVTAIAVDRGRRVRLIAFDHSAGRTTLDAQGKTREAWRASLWSRPGEWVWIDPKTLRIK